MRVCVCVCVCGFRSLEGGIGGHLVDKWPYLGDPAGGIIMSKDLSMTKKVSVERGGAG